MASFGSGKRRQKYMCIAHARENLREAVLGTQEKRAFNSLRCRARQDMLMFGQDHMVMGVRQVLSMLTPEQVANYKTVCLVPVDPALPLTKTNVAIIPNAKARCTIRKWWNNRLMDKWICTVLLYRTLQGSNP